MTPTKAVPVTTTPEAAARIAQLGFQAQIDRMIDYARCNMPDVVRIEVVLNERYEDGIEDGIVITVYSLRPYDPGDRVIDKMIAWEIQEFPPQVLEHVLMDYLPGVEHGG